MFAWILNVSRPGSPQTLLFDTSSWICLRRVCVAGLWLQGVQWHPWSLPTRCQQRPPLSNDSVSRHCQMSCGDKIVPSWEPITKLDLKITSYCQKIPGDLHKMIVLLSVKCRESSSYLHPKFKHRVKQLSLAGVCRLTLPRGNLQIHFTQMVFLFRKQNASGGRRLSGKVCRK